MIVTIVKDMHLQFGFKHPVGRTDDFETHIRQKIQHLIDISLKHKSEAIITTGDLLSVKSPSHYTLKQVRENFSILDTINKHLPIYSIAGNHDLPYSSTQYKKESFYQLLVDSNRIIDLTTQPLQTTQHTIYGIDYNDDTDNILQQLKEIDNQAKEHNKKAITVIHEHIVPTQADKLPFGKYHTYQEITHNLTNHQAIIAGHLHKGYPTQTITNNKQTKITIINPYNFTRLARDYYTVSNLHKPECVIYNLDTNTATHIEIPHQEYKDCFIEKELKAQTQLEMDISNFIKQVSMTKSSNDIDNIPHHIKDRVDYYLERARLNAG